jgi:hypothetical protein
MLAKISAPAAALRVLRLSGPHVGCLAALVKRARVLAVRPDTIKPELRQFCPCSRARSLLIAPPLRQERRQSLVSVSASERA